MSRLSHFKSYFLFSVTSFLLLPTFGHSQNDKQQKESNYFNWKDHSNRIYFGEKQYYENFGKIFIQVEIDTSTLTVKTLNSLRILLFDSVNITSDISGSFEEIKTNSEFPVELDSLQVKINLMVKKISFYKTQGNSIVLPFLLFY